MAFPSSNDSRQVDETELSTTDDFPLPCRPVIESWFRAESGRITPPLEELLTLYLQNELPREYRGRVEERLATDSLFRARLDELTREEHDGEMEGHDVEARRALADRSHRNAIPRSDLEFRGIPVPSEHTSRRNGAPYRFAFREWHAVPFGANDFVQRLLDELGTPFAIELVDHAFCVVAATGEPDSWIREVGRARRRNVLGSEVAYFLIWQFAASAIPRLSETHPVLSKLAAQLERIEGEYDEIELDTWGNRAGPPEWEALCEHWDVARDALLKHILERNEEYETLRDHLLNETPYREGRFQIYGVW